MFSWGGVSKPMAQGQTKGSAGLTWAHHQELGCMWIHLCDVAPESHLLGIITEAQSWHTAELGRIP